MPSLRSRRWGIAAEGGGASAPVLVGRERELARLAVLAESVAGGHGQVVVLSGEAGIGKSRLAAELLTDCAGRGFEVFSGAADEVDQSRPFGVVVDALGVRERSDQARREIARLLDGGGVERPAAGGLGLEARIADLLAGVVGNACGAGPVVVLLDDLQWADQSSLVAVNGIARLASSRGLLVVCVLRRYPIGVRLRALLAALDYRRAHRILLEGLAAGDVAELAARLVGAPPGESTRRVLEEAGGNPFYVSELLACLLGEADAGVSEEGLLELRVAGLPPSLRLTILEGLRFLPEMTLEVLRAGAVVGCSFSVVDVGLISSSAVPDVAAALTPAQRAGIVIADGERLSFRHDLVREAVYDDIAPAVRISMHRYLASRLEQSGAGLERVAAQLMLGASPGDMEAVGWLGEAAREATSSSPAIAAELLSRAVELVGGSGAQRRELLGELVRPLLWTGQAARAEQVCLEGLQAQPPTEEEPLFWLGLINARVLQGRFREARDACREAIGCAALTESDRLAVSTARALSGVFLGEEHGVEAARVIVATAPRSSFKGIAQEALAQWELFRGRADLALAAYEQVDSMRSPAELESRIWGGSGIRVRVWQALALLELDRLEDAAQLLEAEIAARLALPALPHAFLAACRYHAGRFDEAARECQAAIAAAEAAGSFVPASAPALAATIALRQGRVQDAERLAAHAERVRTPVEATGDTIARWTRMLVLEATGDIQAAADAGAGALESYQRAGFASYAAWHAPDLVRVALHADRRTQAQVAVAAGERAAAQLPVASRRAGALRARGLLTADPHVQLDAVVACRQACRPVDLALALCDAAGALASDGQQEKARPLAGEALELLDGLGAAGDERRARALLRGAGVAVSARAKHTRARSGWESLTEAELRVVALATEGRSNPEIAQSLYLSRRTVRWHLSNVFRKLGLSSRVELVAEALRRELP